jgi:hypothetical protein
VARGDRNSMMIQRVATGFLDLFDLKATGESPPLISNELVAMVNVLDMFTVSRRQYVTAVGTQAIGGTTNIPSLGPTVPNSSIWLVHDLFLTVPTAAPAGVTYKVKPGYLFFGFSFVPLGVETNVAVGESLWAGQHFDQPLVLGPGSRLAGIQTAFTGAPALTLNINGIVTQLAV